MRHKHYKYILGFLVLFIAYFATARFGLTLNAVSGFATLVWAPSGIALAAILVLGYGYWPAIFLAAFLINLVTGAKPEVAIGIAFGNTLEPLLGAYLLKRLVKFEPRMERVKDVFGLILFSSLLSTTISATVGVTSLWLGSTISNSVYGSTWIAWWVGDMLGVMIAAPLILVWSQHLKVNLRSRNLYEAAAYLAILAGLSVVVFHGLPSISVKPFALAYIIFPLMIWIALRFGQVGSVSASFVASSVAVWGTVTGSHLTGISLSHKLLLLQSFVGITAITFMTMAAVVTERERSQRQRQQLINKTESLSKQRMRLIALNKAKDDFIALASHQLRTPATTVKVYTAMLLDSYAGKLTKSQKTMLSTAYSSNEKQLELIDALLRVAKLDAGELVLKKEKVDLTLLVNEVIESYNVYFVARNQKVNFRHSEGSFKALIDKEKVRIVLENLLDNASKYSPPGKSISVKLKQDKSQLTIAVQDSGIGIIKKDINKLFKKFSRLENPLSGNVEGTGLGLYWAKKIISLHQGSIEVSSTPNKGSTFTVVFPGSDS